MSQQITTVSNSNQPNNTEFLTSFDISIFEIDKNKGMVNLTKIANHFGKEVRAWNQLASTKKFLTAFFVKNPMSENMITAIGGNNEQGTWASRKLALKFAEWISVDFEIYANEVIDELFATGKVELQPQRKLPTNFLESLELLVQSEKENIKLQLENTQQNKEIASLSNDIQLTREAKAKDYKTVMARNKADIGLSINRLVLKNFKTDSNSFAEANHKSWAAYKHVTGLTYAGATYASYEEKLSFLSFLTSL